MSKYFFGVCLLLYWPMAAFPQQIEWRPSLAEAVSESESGGKPLLLHFSADWCRPCEDLNRFVLADLSVIRFVNQETVPVLIDTDAHPALVQKYSVNTLPAEVLIAKGDRVILSRPSPQRAKNWVELMEFGIAEVQSLKNNGTSAFDTLARLNQQWDHEQSKSKTESGGDAEPFRFDDFHMQNNLKSSDNVTSPANSNSRFAAGSTANEPPTTDSRIPVGNIAVPGPTDASGSVDFMQNPSMAQSENVSATVAPPSGLYARSNPGFTEPANLDSDPQISSPGPGPLSFSNPYVNPNPETGPDPLTAANPDPPRFANPDPQAFTSPESEAVANANPRQFENPDDAQPEIPEPVFPQVSIPESAAVSDPGPLTLKATPSNPTETLPAASLDGLCPVTVLEEGKWVAGDPSIGCVHRGKTYLFQSVEKRDRFLSEPDRWSPLFAGFDPVAFVNQGRLIDGQRAFGIFMKADGEQQVVLFASPENQAEFKSSPAKYLDAIQRATREADERMAVVDLAKDPAP